jgi:hypothetical protein
MKTSSIDSFEALALDQANVNILLGRSAVKSDRVASQTCEPGENRGELEKQAHAAPVAESTPFRQVLEET